MASASNTQVGLSQFSNIAAINANGFGNVSVRGSDSNNEFHFTDVELVGISYIDGGGGGDAIWGSDYRPVALLGGAGNDTLTGGWGADTLDGGAGIDTAVYLQGVSANLTTGTATDGDVLIGVENLIGSTDGDTLVGNTAANLLVGNAGNDWLEGGAGNDTLTGGGGRDEMRGDADLDRFVFSGDLDTGLDADADVILDFASGDIIDVSGIDANANLANNQAFTWRGTAAFTGVAGQLRYEQAGGYTNVYGDRNADGLADMQIVLAGTYTLASTNFSL